MNELIIIFLVVLSFCVIVFQTILLISFDNYSRNILHNPISRLGNIFKDSFIVNIKKVIRLNQREHEKLITIPSFIILTLLILMPTILCNLELFSSIGLTELILDVDHIRRYGFLIVASIIFMGRLSIVLLENTEKFDFNKFAITSAVSFSLIIMNYSYSVYMLNLTAASELVFVYKVISFFNGVISIYIFNSFSTDSKCFEKINFLIINKMLLFFMLYLCMLFINIENSPQDLLKYFYILLSILLTDFVVTKVKKIVGDIKLISFINLKFRKLIYYYVAINLFAAVGVYVL